MENPKIRNLEQLIKVGPWCKMTKLKIQPMPAHGNRLLKVDLTMEAFHGNKEMHVVAKIVPPSRTMCYNFTVTCRNEIQFYKTIVPTLRNFQKESGVEELIHCFPQYYGGRFNNRNHSSKVDQDAVVLLENLSLKKFLTMDKTEGFYLNISKLVVVDLARLHAVPVALKLKKPEEFARFIKPYLLSVSYEEEILEDTKRNFFKLMESIEEVRPYIDRLKKIDFNIYPPPSPREPFATVCHNDVQIKNIMIQMTNGKPMKNKLVDFQLCDYGSPVKDLLFFFFSSVKHYVLVKYYDDLIELYHATFIEVLQELKCDTEPFSLEAFKQEVDYEAKNTQLAYTVLMLLGIFAPKEPISDIISKHKEKLVFIVKEFARRDWI